MARNLPEIECGKIKRKTFSKIKEAIELPYLVKIQKDSYDAFIREGISEVLEDFSPITDYSDHFETPYGIFPSTAKATRKARKQSYAAMLQWNFASARWDSGVAYCMTVHKAKGLEFDTVIIPCNRMLVEGDERTQLIVSEDGSKVGWSFSKRMPDGSTEMLSNENYRRMQASEQRRLMEEETRILYVAMTRAVSNLIVYSFRHGRDRYSWSGLIEGDLQ